SWDDGQYTEDEVTGAWCSGTRPLVRTAAPGFPAISTTADHRFYRTHQGSGARWMPIDRFRTKGPFGSSDHVTLYAYGAPGNERVEHAELFGHLLTDGSVHAAQCPKYTSTDPGLVERVAELATPLGLRPVRRPKGNGWDLGLPSDAARNPLKELFRA